MERQRIDSDGRVLARSLQPQSGLLGRLAKACAKLLGGWLLTVLLQRPGVDIRKLHELDVVSRPMEGKVA